MQNYKKMITNEDFHWDKSVVSSFDNNNPKYQYNP